MQKTVRVKKAVYRYMVKTPKGNDKYSGKFFSKEQADVWYNRHGKELEQVFNRTLKLVCNEEVFFEQVNQ